MKNRFRQNGLVQTILGLTGNQRACLYTEPLWGIPYNLYLPFVSVYMAALGMSPTMIGLSSSIMLASQMVWALLSGVLTDKLGRRLTTIIFDTLSWSVPAFLWMLAQDYRWFLVAALFNGAWRVTETSWGLLLVEDAKQEHLVHLYSIMHVAGLVSGFFAPIAFFFVKTYSIIPTMRVLYGITFVLMTAKFIILYFTTTETSVGKRRMAETRNVALLARLWDSRRVLVKMLHSRRMMLTIGFIACYSGVRSVNDAFWPLLITEKLGIAPENLSIFSTVKTLLMLLSYFVIVPRLDLRRFRNPVLLGLVLFLTQEVLMLFMPTGAYWLVLVSVMMEAMALSLINPMSSALQMVNIDREERARMLGFFYAMCMLVTAPLGTIAGAMAEVNRSLPFVLMLMLTLIAVVLTFQLWRIGLPSVEDAALVDKIEE